MELHERMDVASVELIPCFVRLRRGVHEKRWTHYEMGIGATLEVRKRRPLGLGLPVL